MAGELELDGGGEDPDLAARGVVHEDGLAQAEVGGHALTGLGGTSSPWRNTASGLPPEPSSPQNTRRRWKRDMSEK